MKFKSYLSDIFVNRKIISIFLIGLILGYGCRNYPEDNLLQTKPFSLFRNLFKYDKIHPLTEFEMISFLKKRNIKYIDVVIAQARHETHYYASDIYLFNNNIFGMKNPEIRSTMSAGTKRKHAYYLRPEDSLIDYCLFYNTRIKEVREGKEAYLKYIFTHYAEDPEYERKVMLIVKNKDFQKYIKEQLKKV